MKPRQCPWCHGYGGHTEPILWDGIGGGPFEPCGICGGTGEIKRKRLFYQALAWLPRNRRAKSPEANIAKGEEATDGKK